MNPSDPNSSTSPSSDNADFGSGRIERCYGQYFPCRHQLQRQVFPPRTSALVNDEIMDSSNNSTTAYSTSTSETCSTTDTTMSGSSSLTPDRASQGSKAKRSRKRPSRAKKTLRKRPPMVTPSGRQNKNHQRHTKATPVVNQVKKAAPSFPEIQEWHIVLGDNNCRKGRTTIATNILRQVKTEFQAKHSGSRRADWIPKAIDFFYTQLAKRFAHDVTAPPHGEVLLRCTKKAMDRIQVPYVYGYQGDEKPLFGTVQSPLECLTFFLKSRDAPKLPGELARHERELTKLLRERGPATSSPIPGELVEEFVAQMTFFQQRVTKANQGNVVAQVLLNELNLIPTFRKVWKCLKDQKGMTAPTEALATVDTAAAAAAMVGQGHLGMVDSEGSDDETSVTSDPSGNCSHVSTISLTAFSTAQQHIDKPAFQSFWTLNDPVPTSPLGPERLDDIGMIDDDCMTSVYQYFQQDADQEIESLLSSQDRQERPLGWNPQRDSALEPPGRVLLTQTCRGIDPEPSLEFDNQESDLRNTHQTHQQIDYGEPFVGPEPDGQEEGNGLALVQQQEEEAIPTGGLLGDHPQLVCDRMIHSVPDFVRGESGAISVPTAVPVFGPDFGRGESGEISTLTSVCFAEPTTLDWADSEELTLDTPPFRRFVSDDQTQQETSPGADSHYESIGVPVRLSQDPVILNFVRIPECHVLPDMVPDPLHPKSCCSLQDLSAELDKHRKLFAEIKEDENHPNHDTMLCFEKLLNFFQDQLDMANQGSITAKKLLEDLSATTAMKNQWKELEIQTHTPKDTSLDCQEETSDISTASDCQVNNDNASTSSCDAKTVLAITSPSSELDDDDIGDEMTHENAIYQELQDDPCNDETTFRTNQEIVVACAARTQSLPDSPRRPDPPGRREEDLPGSPEYFTCNSDSSDGCQSVEPQNDDVSAMSDSPQVVQGSRLRLGFRRIRQLLTGARRRRTRLYSNQK